MREALTRYAFILLICLFAPGWAKAKTVTADVVILDHVLVFNRLGSQNVNGMIYALERDVVDSNLVPLHLGGAAVPGKVALRPDKRPRPLVLRANVGDTLVINFSNLLTPSSNPDPPLPDEANPCVGCDSANPLKALDNQVVGRWAGFHVQGMELASSIADDASYVGANGNSLTSHSGGSATYSYLATAEGTFLVTSYGATFGGEASGGNVGVGAFAVVNVQPAGSRYYRSQVTEEELRLARTGLTVDGHPVLPFDTPGVGYEALYPNVEPWISEGKAGLPILNMLDSGNRIVHTDINAIVAGPQGDGSFPASTYPLEARGERNPTVPNRLEPFREFTIVFHDEQAAANAFPAWFREDINPVFSHTTHGVRDSFMINYGSGGIGSEIIANRLGVGPMWDCLDCAYEEFFLSAFTVGDPAMLVDVPANTGLESCGPSGTGCADVGPKANKAFYPDDPSNVHHSYTGDFVKFRNLHAGPKEQHIFHLHNHQWLFNANDDNSNYIDAQGVGPGSGYTYEINFGGSGNRNKTAGDAIFHCHFYPHFAQGMWEMWRIHDTTEVGTELEVSNGGTHEKKFGLKDGTPAAYARALPDGEILDGTPIPAVVPLPGKPMAPMPGRVSLVLKDANGDGWADSSQANVDRTDVYPAGHPLAGTLKNPGFPFWIAGVDCGGPGKVNPATGQCDDGIVGQRPTTPPLDMLTASDASALSTGGDPLFAHPGLVSSAGGFDGGLPRHALDGCLATETVDPLTGQPIPCRVDPSVVEQIQTRFDFRKIVHKAKPVYFPEEGTDLEQAAMRFHALLNHPTTLGGTSPPLAAKFRTNGALPVAGAPYNEPCIDDEGDLFLGPGQFFAAKPGSFFTASPQFSAAKPRIYKAANIQLDAVFNKVGYHFPQQRIISLWEDVMAFDGNLKPPEPFVIRMNTFDCTQYYHSNLVPSEYQLDDYQVRTPTDIIGQHIHLPKWDLVSADGSANGWNYEDGTLSPEMVIERIEAINHFNDDPTRPPVPTLKKPDGSGGGLTHLTPTTNTDPSFPTGHAQALGARTTIQRWFADPVVNTKLEDRGLGIIFTHDHFGPSTHQQVGLYATVLTEPAGSTWRHNETGELMATRPDGGPTSWQAVITDFAAGGDGQPADDQPFREFYFEFADFQHAYEGDHKGVLSSRDDSAILNPDPDAFRSAINPSVRQEVGNPAIAGDEFPDIMRFPKVCPGGVPRPCPEAISADDVGMLVVNYRNEPVGLRVYDPNKTGPDGKPGMQADGKAGDLAYALQTRTDRKVSKMNARPADLPFWSETLNSQDAVLPGDPFTPMMRTRFGDLVRVKVQAGAHEHEHNATIHGLKWLQGGSSHGKAPNSGWRNSQNVGISEQFTFSAPIFEDVSANEKTLDLAYSMDASQDGWWSGVWGVLRAYNDQPNDLYKLDNEWISPTIDVLNRFNFTDICPSNAPGKSFDITAVLANEVLGNAVGANLVPVDASANMHVGGSVDPDGGTLVYNRRGGVGQSSQAQFNGPLHDPTGLLYVHTQDLEPQDPTDPNCVSIGPFGGALPYACPAQLKAGVPVEPLVLRAAAGDCVKVTLRNKLPEKMPDLAGFNTLLQMVIRDHNDSDGGVTTFNNNLIRPSAYVGLHPQMVEFDSGRDNGILVGINPETDQLVAPGGEKSFKWYMGHFEAASLFGGASVSAHPVEFGASNLLPADVIKQGQKGLVGALVVEPKDSTWAEDSHMRAAASVSTESSLFRDFAVVFQKGLNLKYGDGSAIPSIAGEGGQIPEDSHDAGQAAINYRTEPAWFRFGLPADSAFGSGPSELGSVSDAHRLYSNGLAGGYPETPVFVSRRGRPFRMRVLEPTGVGRGTTFDLHGHVWQRDPYLAVTVPSDVIGDNPLGFYLGGQESVTPSAHFDIVLPSAGGSKAILGDYLFRDHGSFGNTNGLWGILSVGQSEPPTDSEPTYSIGVE
ncbi:MAG: hypothetical protein AAF657_01770 [Acidobacteriota bacterium]